MGKKVHTREIWYKCKNCLYEWLPRVKEPRKCPKCGTRQDRFYFKKTYDVIRIDTTQPTKISENISDKHGQK